LSLEDFGYYMLAYSITTMTIGIFSNSVTNVVFPNFSRLTAQNNTTDLIKNFHLSSQLMTWGMVSITTILALFSQEILLVWARNPLVAEKTSVLLSVWAIGMGLNTLAMIPYYVQLAYGRSNISFRFNLIALILNVPALIITSNLYGALGAACCWLTLNAIYLVTFIPSVQKNFLSFSLKDWYLKDVGKIALVGILIGLIFRHFITPDIPHVYLFILIGLCFTTIAGVTFFITELPKFTLKYDLFYRLKRKFL